MSNVYFLPMLGLKKFFLTSRFFVLFGSIVGLFVLSYVSEVVFYVALACLLGAVAITLFDAIQLFRFRIGISAQRITPQLLSLGDENPITLQLHSSFSFPVSVEIIDEIPVQFQDRDFSIQLKLEAQEEKALEYKLRPTSRGEYLFEKIHAYSKSPLGLVCRRDSVSADEAVPVYPSVLQMKKFELKAISSIATQAGVKKIRRLGHSYEFEQIKNYVAGDDYRSINWKASSRKGELMVNQYTDEKSQRVYALVDKSRSMKMPFNGLSLLDYAINSSLVISNVAVQKHDNAGLITFSDNIDTIIKADRTPKQMNRILEALYREKEHHLEANYEKLYHAVRSSLDGRSLLILFTNFESQYAMQRVLPLLRKLNRLHLLLVVFFENGELMDFANQSAEATLDIYEKTMARRINAEKDAIIQELTNHGIQAIKSTPEDLSINTINKYLELKAKGMI